MTIDKVLKNYMDNLDSIKRFLGIEKYTKYTKTKDNRKK